MIKSDAVRVTGDRVTPAGGTATPADRPHSEARARTVNSSKSQSALEASHAAERVVEDVKRLTRCQKGRNCRMLVVTDSQVALGCFRKGRSSNRGLLHLARRLAGLVLGYNLRLSLRYVPSHCNLADGPSRGSRRVGVARSTARKAALNASTRPYGFRAKDRRRALESSKRGPR